MHLYKSAIPNMAAPAPSPGTRFLGPAPLAGDGDAAVEAIVVEPIPEASAKEFLESRQRKPINLKADAHCILRCPRCGGHEDTTKEPRTGHGGRCTRARCGCYS